MKSYEKILSLKNKYIAQIKYIYEKYIKAYDKELTEEEMKEFGLYFVGIKKDKFMYLSAESVNYINLISERDDKYGILNKIKNSNSVQSSFNILTLFCFIKGFLYDLFSPGLIKGDFVDDFFIGFLIKKGKIIIGNKEIFHNINKNLNKLSKYSYIKNLFGFIEKEIYFAIDYERKEHLLDKNFDELDFNKYNYLYNFPEKKKRLTRHKNFISYTKDKEFYVVTIDSEARQTSEPVKVESIPSSKPTKTYIDGFLKEGYLVNEFFYYNDFKNKIKVNSFEIEKGYNLISGSIKSYLVYSDVNIKKNFINQNYYLSFSEVDINNIKYRVIFYKYRLYLVEINDKLFGYGIKDKQVIKNIKNKTNELLEASNKIALFVNL